MRPKICWVDCNPKKVVFIQFQLGRRGPILRPRSDCLAPRPIGPQGAFASDRAQGAHGRQPVTQAMAILLLVALHDRPALGRAAPSNDGCFPACSRTGATCLIPP